MSFRFEQLICGWCFLLFHSTEFEIWTKDPLSPQVSCQPLALEDPLSLSVQERSILLCIQTDLFQHTLGGYGCPFAARKWLCVLINTNWRSGWSFGPINRLVKLVCMNRGSTTNNRYMFKVQIINSTSHIQIGQYSCLKCNACSCVLHQEKSANFIGILITYFYGY